ncbi:peptide chain release factor N(5)-glutamine methyltransferase [Roseovarius sp. SYSU LYC5161]|uniref:peptide chain release factor N(5)-glutamine methyltransferase n=1 Tax=Roseovarius halophilus (ex Wu et al. 2025) TaxID=3376060 RepID=UPI00399C423A
MTAPATARTAGEALARALRQAAARLTATDAPMREARLLLAHAAGLERGQLHRLAPGDFTPALMEVFLAMADRRARGEPLSKITGTRDFWKHGFRVTRDVLDPRPDTETLVAAAIELPFDRVLDLGTGSGCILLSLLAERPGATGLGTDISAAALDVARENAHRLGVAARVDFRVADWIEGLPGGFDLVVSNPPYIAADEMATLAPELAHDPAIALTDAGDGLGAYRVIVPGAAGLLRAGGRLMVEIGWRQGAAVSALLRDTGFEDVAILPDLDGRDRVVLGRKPG